MTFNPGQGEGIPERLLQDRIPRPGDSISYFDARTQMWRDAIITKDLSNRWPNYFNIAYDDGTQDGLYLIRNTRWTFRHREDNFAAIEAQRLDDHLSSLKPTPETTPEQFFLDDSDASSVDIFNKSHGESLEWDMAGIHLESSYASTPVHDDPIPTDVPLNQVCRLDTNLPLTSTWRTSTDTSILRQDTVPKEKRRLAQPRRPLPAEFPEIRGFLPRFARRLDPFKKKEKP